MIDGLIAIVTGLIVLLILRFQSEVEKRQKEILQRLAEIEKELNGSD